ncbi:MAG TPA: tetratricopeptide repeat protein, partial [Polyangia bacterium]|nr:tetratricopeptide repeat protein [Polyangia bacterium]
MSSGEHRLIRSLTSPTLRPGRRLIPALVGHNSEWLTLAGELERAIKGRGRFVRIIGDVGVGKSRLKMELYRELEARGIAVREARASEAVAGSALGPFVDLLHAWLRSLGAYGGDSRLRAFKRLARQSGLSTSEAARIEGLLITSGGVGGSGGDEQARGRAEAFAAFRTLLLSTQRTAPLVLVLEDFHLADPQSVELTLELAQHIRQSATLLLVIETISSAAFEREPNRVDIVLSPLGALAARKLLREVLPDVDLPAELFERIEPAIRGNPGFLLQTLHAWVDAELLQWDGSRYRFATPPQRNDVPTSMQQAVERRLVRLAPEDRRLLLQGSVLGRAFSPRILVEIETAMTGEGRSTIAARLERISNANLLDPTSQSGRLGFMHGAIYEQVRTLLRPEDAARIHQLAAEAYLSADESEDTISPEQLAHHWQSAGQPYKAVPHLIAAADRSRVAFDYERAATVYHQALELLQSDTTHEGIENRRRIWENLSDVLLVRGDYEAARSALSSARRARSEDQGTAANPIEEARHLKKLASIAQKTGQYPEALHLCQQALALVEDIDPLMAASLEALGGLTLCYQGQYAQAQEWIMRGLSRIDETTQTDERARLAIEAALHRAHGNLLVDMGRPQEAVEEYEKGAPLCEQLGDRWELSIVYFNIGAAQAQAGRPAQALESLERALTAKLAIGDRWGLSYTYHAMAEIHAELGAPQRQARTSGGAAGPSAGMIQGAGAGSGPGGGGGPGAGATGVTTASSSLSGVDRALVTLAFNEAQKGLVLAQEVGDPKILAALRVTLGRLHLLENELDAAERQFAEAFASAHAINALPEVIGSKLGMAALYRERRAYGLALHEAESAYRLAQERGLPRWMVESLISVGDSLLKQGAYEDAERKYAVALQSAGKVQNPILESTALAALTHVKRLKPAVGSRETGRPSGGEGGREAVRGTGRGSVKPLGRGPDRQTGGMAGKDAGRAAPIQPGAPEAARPFRDTGKLLFKDLNREGAPVGR